ncbi:hypothetical protein AGR7A_Cc250083 [Agrobacterium deltaense NCPPB 1641]|uniref:Uncharacterized protein n=1 Tax=Agrobacterium deltaense NCPPB 1641 TaxID=1183425 RepID=A0A1S7TNV9_9HYPH|nr:hypothetical protein AGR7A_Cc250083 [Agrobacterium deltaense NCPPB 1641]
MISLPSFHGRHANPINARFTDGAGAVFYGRSFLRAFVWAPHPAKLVSSLILPRNAFHTQFAVYWGLVFP